MWLFLNILENELCYSGWLSSRWKCSSKIIRVNQTEEAELYCPVHCKGWSSIWPFLQNAFGLDGFVWTLHLLQGLLWQGLCCLLCLAHLPCCRQGFKPQQKCQHPEQSSLGGSRVEGSQGGASHAVPPDSPEIPPGGRDSLWAHLYFNYFSGCSLCRAVAGGQTRQHCSGFSCSSHHPWAQCCVCPAPGRARAAWKSPAAQAVGVERAARQGKQPFIPVRLRATG